MSPRLSNNTDNIIVVFMCVVVIVLVTLSYVVTYTVGYNSGDNNGRQYVISSIELQKCGILKKNIKDKHIVMQKRSIYDQED